MSVVVAAGFAAPFLYLLVRTATLGPDLGRILASPDLSGPLRRSLTLAAAVSTVTAVVGSALAWLTARSDLPGRRLWRVLVPLPLVIPSFVGASAFLAAFAPGGLAAQALGALGVDRVVRVEGFWGAFAVLTLLTYPYVYLPVAARLGGLPPSLEESARLLGCRPPAVFGRVVLPQIRGAVAGGALLVFLYTISDFGAVALLRYDTLTRAIYSARLSDRATSLILSAVLGLVAVAVVAAERRLAGHQPALPAAAARPPLLVPLRRWRLPALGLIAAVVGLGLVAPVVVLGWWAGRGLAGGTTGVGAVTADLSTLLEPALRTAGVGLVTAAVAVAVVLPVAFLTTRHRRRAGDAIHGVVLAGFALPGLVIALALGFWALQAPRWLAVYQTLPLLVLAYVIHFGAQPLRVAQVAVAAVPARLGEAARMLGASAARRLWRVELPLMVPGLLAAAGLVLLSVMKELPATLLLAPIGFSTLATRIWNANEDGFLADVGLASLVLLALSGLLTWLLVIRRSETVG